MAVAVLMYHDTPRDEPNGPFDVRLDMFKAQIKILLDMGVAFIPFSRAHDPDMLKGGRQVAVTFDDGNGSNAAAIEFLHDCGIRPTQFIVADWSRTGIGELGDSGYMRADDIRRLSAICDFGGHGTTHRAMSRMTSAELAHELVDVREFVEQASGQPVDTMSFPGGVFTAETVQSAKKAGFRLCGNSVFDINTHCGETVNRLVVGARDDAYFPSRMVFRPAMVWKARKLARRLLRR